MTQAGFKLCVHKAHRFLPEMTTIPPMVCIQMCLCTALGKLLFKEKPGKYKEGLSTD